MRKAWALLVIPLVLGTMLALPVTTVQACQPGQQNGLNGAVLFCLKLTVVVHSGPVLRNDLLASGYTATCGDYKQARGECPLGWTYTLDPTVHVVNGGMDCIQFKVHGVKSGTTCSVSSKSAAGNQNATYLMVSASSGHTPAFTDTSCTATVATTNGFSIAAGTPTAGTPSSGSEVLQVTYTWTGATSATSSLDLACMSWTNSNAANTLYAMGQIGTTTVNVGDTLQTLWSITYASS